MNNRDLRGLNFVFAGGSSGIGRAAALEVAKLGASILIIGRGRRDGESTVGELRGAGAASADFLAVDISTVDGIRVAAGAIRSWKPQLHGLVHSAMSAFAEKKITSDGFELAFALQYFARAALNRLLVDRLEASGDGRIVHIAGAVPKSTKIDLSDLQYARRKWTFFSAILGTHVLGYLHAQEAARRWKGRPVAITISCVGATKTKVMRDREMPLIMRMLGLFGTTPERSAMNAVRLLTQSSPHETSGAILRDSRHYSPAPLTLDTRDAEALWNITSKLAVERGLQLGE